MFFFEEHLILSEYAHSIQRHVVLFDSDSLTFDEYEMNDVVLNEKSKAQKCIHKQVISQLW